MATVTIEMKLSDDTIVSSSTTTRLDAQLTAFINYFAAAQRYEDFLSDGETPNPESKADFLVRKIKEYVGTVITAYLATVAADEARDEVLANPVTL